MVISVRKLFAAVSLLTTNKTKFVMKLYVYVMLTDGGKCLLENLPLPLLVDCKYTFTYKSRPTPLFLVVFK